MNSSPLEQPRAVYRPFTREETDLLRGFVEDVKRLGKMRFFEQVPKTASMTFDAQGLRSEMEEPDEQDLRAAITQFRQLYDHDEPRSFRKAMKLLKRSAHEHNGPLRDAAIDELDRHIQSERDALRAGIGMGIVFEDPTTGAQRPIDTRTIIDAYLHGKYLHSGNPKSELARQLDELQPFPQMTLYSVMLKLRNVYWVAANVNGRALAVPDLLDADAAQATTP